MILRNIKVKYGIELIENVNYFKENINYYNIIPDLINYYVYNGGRVHHSDYTGEPEYKSIDVIGSSLYAMSLPIINDNILVSGMLIVEDNLFEIGDKVEFNKDGTIKLNSKKKARVIDAVKTRGEMNTFEMYSTSNDEEHQDYINPNIQDLQKFLDNIKDPDFLKFERELMIGVTYLTLRDTHILFQFNKVEDIGVRTFLNINVNETNLDRLMYELEGIVVELTEFDLDYAIMTNENVIYMDEIQHLLDKENLMSYNNKKLDLNFEYIINFSRNLYEKVTNPIFLELIIYNSTREIDGGIDAK